MTGGWGRAPAYAWVRARGLRVVPAASSLAFRELNRAGTTIIQVTHSEANAAAGDRVIELADGWVVGEKAAA